jgi:hypothetical protein
MNAGISISESGYLAIDSDICKISTCLDYLDVDGTDRC